MPAEKQWQEVNAAFSKQSSHFDSDDSANPILSRWRERVYRKVEKLLKPNSKILELNAGTGIDAVHFAKLGHRIHATDLSDGMIEHISEKIKRFSLEEEISLQQVSFENLHEVKGRFDLVFSNFGGLNCTDDLTKVTTHLPQLLNSNGLVIWSIMPRMCPWEWLWVLKGKTKQAFRRFKKGGAESHLEGHYFLSHYFSLSQIQKAMPAGFEFISSESLGCFSPPPAAIQFIKSFPRTTRILNSIDGAVTNVFPFNRWGDHLIVAFRFRGSD